MNVIVCLRYPCICVHLKVKLWFVPFVHQVIHLSRMIQLKAVGCTHAGCIGGEWIWVTIWHTTESVCFGLSIVCCLMPAYRLHLLLTLMTIIKGFVEQVCFSCDGHNLTLHWGFNSPTISQFFRQAPAILSLLPTLLSVCEPAVGCHVSNVVRRFVMCLDGIISCFQVEIYSYLETNGIIWGTNEIFFCVVQLACDFK